MRVGKVGAMIAGGAGKWFISVSGVLNRKGNIRKSPIFVKPCARVTPRMLPVRWVMSPKNMAATKTKIMSSRER